jgi:hypothetical protein
MVCTICTLEITAEQKLHTSYNRDEQGRKIGTEPLLMHMACYIAREVAAFKARQPVVSETPNE